MSLKINIVPVANYRKECCVGVCVCVALPLIVQITNTCTAAIESQSLDVNEVGRSKENLKKVRRMIF